MSENALAATDSSVYYGSGYWNEIPAVYRELCRRATGDPDMPWMEHLLARHGRPFRTLLSLNCGNGWVERDLLRRGVAEAGVGIDYADDLLAAARREADAEGLALEYRQADINVFDFQLDGIDLVVNHAACHHIARLDQVMRAICRLLPPDGVFVSWDYVGPHRNQYPVRQWEAVFAANQALPPALRKELRYPHMKSMLVGDPTEAIHSELILPVMRRYFDIEHISYLGGGLAYEILNFNPPFHAQPRPDEAIRQLLQADLDYLGDDPEHNTLFAYAIARPRKSSLDDEAQLARWATEEDQREAEARANGGRYQPLGLLEDLYDRVYALELSVATGRPPVIEGQATPSAVQFITTRWRRRARSLAGRAVRAVRRATGRPQGLSAAGEATTLGHPVSLARRLSPRTGAHVTIADTLRKIPGLPALVRRVRRTPATTAIPPAGPERTVKINHGTGGTTPPFPLKPSVDRAQLAKDVAARTWFHTFDFGGGIVAHGNDPSHDKTRYLGIPERLDGKSVLDIGTFEGHYAFEAARRGASDVLATDKFVWEWPGTHWRGNFEFVRDRLDLVVRDQVISVEDLSPETVGTFDVVFFFGVLYHSPDPLGYLKRVRSVTKEFALIETVVDLLDVERPALAYYPGAYLNNDASNYFGPNIPGLEGLLLDAGFSRVDDLGLWRLHELELTRKEPLPTGAPKSGRTVVKAWV